MILISRPPQSKSSLPLEGESETSCANCNNPLPGQAVYCPVCGQSVKEINKPWRAAIRELLTELLDFDGRMLISLRLLLTRPGFLSYEYINGRRVSYTSPIRMYLVISLVFFFVLPLILPDVTVTSPSHEVSVDLLSQAMFLLLPLFALLLKIFYRQTFYLAHLVFAVHLFSAMFIVFAITMSIENAADRYIAVILLQLLLLLYVIVYFVIALHTTYRESWLKSVLKFLALLVIFLPILGGAIELTSHTGGVASR
jgi:hypothetical protein